MSLLSITASGQWWSTTNGWFTPASLSYPAASRDGQFSVAVTGTLSNGTILVVQRRIRADLNGGTAGTAIPVLVIDAAFIAARGRTGYTDDFNIVNTAYEFDIGCPSTFGSGDTVSVELR